MDPTFADHLRQYLAALVVEHQEAEPPATGCLCGSDLDDASLADHILDVMTAAVAEPTELAPHVVHVDGALEELEPVYRIDPEDPEGKAHARDENGKRIKVTGRRHVGPTDCPDCGRGLSSRGASGMLCPRLSRDLELVGCHEGCIVACGLEVARG